MTFKPTIWHPITMVLASSTWLVSASRLDPLNQPSGHRLSASGDTVAVRLAGRYDQILDKR
jgi:hypothetical protein